MKLLYEAIFQNIIDQINLRDEVGIFLLGQGALKQFKYKMRPLKNYSHFLIK